MNDERYEYWEARVQERFLYWLKVLGLADWEWSHSFHREGGRGNGGSCMFANINPSWEYRNMHINWFINIIEEQQPNERQFDAMIAHELLHAVVDEMGTEVPGKRMKAHQRHEERVVSMLAESFSQLELACREEVTKRDKTITRLQRKILKLQQAA